MDGTHDELRLRFAEFDAKQWPGWYGDREPGTGRSPRAYLVSLACLGFLVTPVRDALHVGPPAQRAALLVDIALYSAGFLFAIWRGMRADRRTRVLAVAWLFATGLGIPLLFWDVAAMPYLTYAIVIAVLALPARYSRILGVGTALALLVASTALTGEPDWSGAFTLSLVTIAVSSIFLLNHTIGRLRLANAAIADLAANQERTRLARDLHDLLGHSLTTITVKSGLARRVLESGAEQDRAIAEVRDVEELSRQAMAEVRAAVSGYHAISLATEVASARATLRAAGIAADLPHAVDDVRADLREAFAWVLREGVTNVLKHSGATTCVVRLGPTWLEVRDDGRGLGDAVRGNGLRGLAERVRVVGAELETRSGADGFVLRASVG